LRAGQPDVVETGAHPKAVQSVMRHSTITLTMDTYGHLFPGQEAEAVVRLADLLADAASEALRATGAAGPAPSCESGRAAHARRRGGVKPRAAAQGGEGKTDRPEESDSRKSLQTGDFGESRRGEAQRGKSRPGRIRTCNQQIMSLLL
jgi:hypothetical protein